MKDSKENSPAAAWENRVMQNLPPGSRSANHETVTNPDGHVTGWKATLETESVRKSRWTTLTKLRIFMLTTYGASFVALAIVESLRVALVYMVIIGVYVYLSRTRWRRPTTRQSYIAKSLYDPKAKAETPIGFVSGEYGGGKSNTMDLLIVQFMAQFTDEQFLTAYELTHSEQTSPTLLQSYEDEFNRRFPLSSKYIAIAESLDKEGLEDIGNTYRNTAEGCKRHVLKYGKESKSLDRYLPLVEIAAKMAKQENAMSELRKKQEK